MSKNRKRDELLNNDFVMSKITNREKNSYVDIHWHNEVEIVYILEGQIYLLGDSGDDGIFLTEGDSVLVPPGCTHDIGKNSVNTKALIIQFRLPEMMRTKHGGEKSLKLLLNKMQGIRVIRKQDRFSSQLSFLCREVYRVCQEQEPEPERILQGAIQMLLSYYNETVQTIWPDVLETKNDSFSLMEICDFIDEVGFASVTADAVADHIGYSKKYFSSKFKELTGISFKEFLDRLKMQEARRMLGEGKRATEVAAILGYSCVQNFSRAFKRMHNISIKEMIDKHR